MQSDDLLKHQARLADHERRIRDLEQKVSSVPSHLILYNGGRSRRSIHATHYGHGSVNG